MTKSRQVQSQLRNLIIVTLLTWLVGMILIPFALSVVSANRWYNMVLSPPIAGQGGLVWASVDWSTGPVRRVSSIAIPDDSGRLGGLLGVREVPNWTLASQERPAVNGEIILETAVGIPFTMTRHAERHPPINPTIGYFVHSSVIFRSLWTGLPGPATEPTRWVWWGIVGNLIVWALIGLGAQRVLTAWRGRSSVAVRRRACAEAASIR